MNKTLCAGIGFLLGACVGGLSTYIFTKKKYDTIIEEEVSSARETYQRLAKELAEKNKVEKEKIFAEFAEKASEYAEEEKMEEEKTNDIPESEEVKPYQKVILDHQVKPDIPYEITASEYGAVDGYNLVSLNYYTDGVITDSNDEPIDFPGEMISEDVIDKLQMYLYNGIYTAYVRNDTKQCDYEVFLNGTDFEEV